MIKSSRELIRHLHHVLADLPVQYSTVHGRPLYPCRFPIIQALLIPEPDV